MKHLNILCSIVLMSILGCGNSAKGNTENPDNLKILLCENEHVKVYIENDTLFCYLKDNLLFSQTSSDSLTVTLDDIDSVLIVNNNWFTLSEGNELFSEDIKRKNYNFKKKGNERIEVFPSLENLLVVNNYSQFDILIDSLSSPKSVFNGNSGMYLKSESRFITSQNFVRFLSVHDVILGFKYWKDPKSAESASLLTYDIFNYQEKKLVRKNRGFVNDKACKSDFESLMKNVISNSEVLSYGKILSDYKFETYNSNNSEIEIYKYIRPNDYNLPELRKIKNWLLSHLT